jgi:hypothetical protein
MKEKDCISVRVGLPFLALALLFLGPHSSGTSSLAAQPTPRWWEISIVLKTEGEYMLEGKESDCRGNYSFLIHWRGCLERDDDDYILYHVDSRLADWKAQETVSSPKSTAILTTHEIKRRPSLSLKHILRRETNLFLNFLVKGLVVPESGGGESFFLFFPSSEENGQRRSQVDYNDCVVEGSNGVSLKEAEIYAGPVTKEYSWTWKHQKRESRQDVTVSASQSHRTRVSLSIIPHYAGPQ